MSQPAESKTMTSILEEFRNLTNHQSAGGPAGGVPQSSTPPAMHTGEKSQPSETAVDQPRAEAQAEDVLKDAMTKLVPELQAALRRGFDKEHKATSGDEFESELKQLTEAMQDALRKVIDESDNENGSRAAQLDEATGKR